MNEDSVLLIPPNSDKTSSKNTKKSAQTSILMFVNRTCNKKVSIFFVVIVLVVSVGVGCCIKYLEGTTQENQRILEIEKKLLTLTTELGKFKQDQEEVLPASNVANIQHYTTSTNQGFEVALQKLKKDFETQIESVRKALIDTFNWKTAYYNEYAYVLTPQALSWSESQKNCQNMGGELAVYRIQQEHVQKEISNHISISGNIWIGLKRQGEVRNHEEGWNWVDGTRSTTLNTMWNEKEPNNFFNREENCGELWSGKWKINDENCGRQQHALCEKKILIN